MDIAELIKQTDLRVLTVPEHESTLRTKSVNVPDNLLGSNQLKLFVQHLYKAMMEVDIGKGWVHTGVAAIQVGIPINLFIAFSMESDEYISYVNTDLELVGYSTDEKLEACLSIPEVSGKVRRVKRIKMSYIDLNGVREKQKLSGWSARVIQHEFDHVNGILFTDKLVED